MTCTQKEDKTRIVKNHHPTIKRIPDELWDEIKKVLPKERPPSKTVGRPIVKHRKVLDGILYVLRTEGCQWKMIPKEYGSGSTCHRRFQEWNILGIFKRTWIKLLKIYDKEIGINGTWQTLDSISIKSPLGGAMTGNNPTDRSKLGTKRHILTDKEGIPLFAVISPASTHYIDLVTDVVDNKFINRRRRRRSQRPSVHKSKLRNRKRLEHLCLDKAYISKQEERELIKRGYVLHIPIKKKKGREKDDEQKPKAIPNRKKYSAKRWVS